MKKKLIVIALCVAMASLFGCGDSSNNTSNTVKSPSSTVNTNKNNDSTVQKVEDELNDSYKNFSVSDGGTDECKFLYISTTTENDTEEFGYSLSQLTFKSWFDYDYVLINFTLNDSVVSSLLCDISSSEVYLSHWDNPISSEPSDSQVAVSSSDDSSSTVNDLPNESDDNVASIPSYSSNQYKVGVDIPAGEYILLGENSYFDITSDANGSDIILNENFDNDYIVTLNDGEYFTLKRATAYPFEQYCSSNTIDTTQNNGMLKIGVNLPAGEYRLSTSNGMGYYCIYTDSRCRDIVSNDNFDSSTYITVSDGQYLLFKRCTIQQ